MPDRSRAPHHAATCSLATKDLIARAGPRWESLEMVEGRVESAAPPTWDVAIVGGGPSGISTALHLQAAAPRARIVVLEKERYPREKICAGGIGARAFHWLDKPGGVGECPHVAIDAIALRLPPRPPGGWH